MYLAYILSVASSCCLSHIASCIFTSFSKLTLNLKQKKLFKIIAIKPITIVLWKKIAKKMLNTMLERKEIQNIVLDNQPLMANLGTF